MPLSLIIELVVLLVDNADQLQLEKLTKDKMTMLVLMLNLPSHECNSEFVVGHWLKIATTSPCVRDFARVLLTIDRSIVEAISMSKGV